jgi:hypothetical protein
LHRKTTWLCQCGFEWEATGQVMIKRKDPCQRCVGKETPTIETLRKFARKRGGKCLSKTYVNNRKKYLWECESGHQWRAKWSNVGSKNRTWCPTC